jgi:hypothetical protein
LDGLYFDVITEAVTDGDGDVSSENAAQLHNILEVVIFAREPLTPHALAQLLDMDRSELDAHLSPLLSVLVVPDHADESGVVRPLHQSFPDFVVQQGKHIHHLLHIDVKIVDFRITEYCLQLMNKRLHIDMCNIQDPSLLNDEVADMKARLDEHVSDALRYSSRFMPVHLLEHIHAADTVSRFPMALDIFCHEHIFHWIEVTSLTGAFDSVRQVMPKLLSAINVSFIMYTCVIFWSDTLCRVTLISKISM